MAFLPADQGYCRSGGDYHAGAYYCCRHCLRGQRCRLRWRIASHWSCPSDWWPPTAGRPGQSWTGHRVRSLTSPAAWVPGAGEPGRNNSNNVSFSLVVLFFLHYQSSNWDCVGHLVHFSEISGVRLMVVLRMQILISMIFLWCRKSQESILIVCDTAYVALPIG